MKDQRVEELEIDQQDLVQLLRLTAASGVSGSRPILRRLARRYRDSAPEVANAIVSSLRESPLRAQSPGTPLSHPLDGDSKLPLIREEHPVLLAHEPILARSIREQLEQIVMEHRSRDRLLADGLAPTRTALLVGEPGVGKTLAARWVARELDVPLLVLDLSSVMSSLLGRTGGNIRQVLDYARSVPCVLLLDELDAVAKRRDDVSEIGELKRLVTVLLQEIDAWPDDSLLLAATNHADLLDPAVWRRFESLLEFPLPDAEALRAGVRAFLPDDNDDDMMDILGALYEGETLSRLERDALHARRVASLQGQASALTLVELAKDRFAQLSPRARVRLATSMLERLPMSQRAVHELTGVSRDTLRKYARTARSTR